MITRFFVTTAILALAALSLNARAGTLSSDARTPVLVELFTSEGCSDCPPADALLAKLDREQPINGAQAIVLSEHVDYWNHLGWSDPYSSVLFSRRQEEYGDRFRLSSIYTPQMVVNGSREFVGSDARQASAAISDAAHHGALPLEITALSPTARSLRFHVKSGAVTNDADLYAVIALESATSSVQGGENSGRSLSHVAVVRTFAPAAKLTAGQMLDQDVTVPLAALGSRQLRVIAFLQEKSSKRVVAAGMQPFTAQ
jgi:hypothetical protein